MSSDSKKRNKKAFMEVEVIKIILIIFSFILLFVFLYRFYSKSTEFAGEQACHSSLVLTQTLAKKVGYGSESLKPWPETCKTKDMTSKATTAEQAEREIAESMSWCWWEMGEGVMKPFDSDWLSTHRKCFICYTTQFPYLKNPISREDLLFYLQNKGNKGTTYYSYLKYGDEKVIDNPIVDPIMNDRIYAIIYTNPKEWALANYLGCILKGTGTGGTVGVIASLPGVVAGGLLGTAISTTKCTADWITRWANDADNDMVYIVDVNRKKADTGEKLEMGCEGGIFTEVQTS